MRTKNIVVDVVLLLLVLPGMGLGTLRAQGLDEQVRLMRDEIQQLRHEVETLRQELHGTEASPESDEASPAEILPMVQAELQEQAQTKVETNSKFPMKLFGSIISTTAWNSGTPNWMDIPNIAGPPTPGQSPGSFTSTLRQSRIGAMFDGPTIHGMKSSALFSMDFFGGIPNFSTGQTMGLPRLVYAYVRLENDRTAFEVGQDQMILAPRNPTSLAAQAFPLLYRSGNLYLKVPQIRVERVLSHGSFGEVRAVAGIVAPVAGDASYGTYEFVPPAGAGERSGMPGVQGRLAWKAPKWELGASAHYSRERDTSNILTPSWATAFDFDAMQGRFGTGGEFFVGRNLAGFGGSIGQLAESRGGFFEGRFNATRQLNFNAGYGTDRLIDLVRFPAPLTQNSSAFANTIYQFKPEFSATFEYRWLGTKALLPDTRRNNHLNLTFAYSF